VESNAIFLSLGSEGEWGIEGLLLPRSFSITVLGAKNNGCGWWGWIL
jgi:hypothetical protein